MFFTFINIISILLYMIAYGFISYFIIFKKELKTTIKSTYLIGFLLVIFEILIPLAIYFLKK
ncbi:hypothetical protein A1D23_12525 [Chelonobacter oris]|nr:hypothetical protein [Chelonobacter oris]